MNKILDNFYFYLLLSVDVIAVLIILVYKFSGLGFEKSVNITVTIIKVLVIFMGGRWAYIKLFLEKRAESAIRIKAMMMDYAVLHNRIAGEYQVNKQKDKDWLKCWSDFANKMIPLNNEINRNIHLSCYVPKNIRIKLFNVLFLSLNNGKSPKTENLEKNWKDFEEKIEDINKELDKLVLGVI